MGEPVVIERDGAVARLVVRCEALDEGGTRALAEALEALSDDDGVRVVVLSVSGSGLEPRATGLDEFRKPVVAVCEGVVSGGALALALAADMRMAGEGATFAVPEVAEGRLPPAGTIARLVRLVGRGDAARLLLTGEAIDAAEARRIGLVSEVVLDAASARGGDRAEDRGAGAAGGAVREGGDRARAGDAAGAGAALRDGPDDHPAEHGRPRGGGEGVPGEAGPEFKGR